MAVSAGTAVLQVAPQLVKSFSRDVVSQMAGPAQKAANKTGKESGRKFGVGFSGGIRTGVGPIRGIMRGFGPALAGAFGAAALVQGIKSVTDEAREAAVVGRQTAAVLKSTGGAANISAKGVAQLAEALSNKVGVDDEAIQSSQNLLLTFTGIRNEAGKGNAIFNQASTAILDMTASMNRGQITANGLKSATIQVGKALNDPIKGMTALSKVGVSFTSQQKEQIKTLVESGDKLGAQKIILAELRKEFSGSAAASADAGKRFGVVIGNLKEQIGTALLPVLASLADWLSVKIPEALRVVTGALKTGKKWWDENKVAVQLLSDVLSSIFVPSANDAANATGGLTSKTIKLESILKAITLAAGYLTIGFLHLEKKINGIISITASFITATGHAVNAVDRLSGGSGRAGDAIVAFGRDLKETARKELQGINRDARNAQAAIDRLHGKNVNITGTTSMQFTKSFTQKDWLSARLAAGRMAAGGLVQGPGGPTADMVPAMLSAGEAVVPARLVPAVAPFLGAHGVPGFALGGKIDQTGQAHTGVGKIMDRAGTVQMAALIQSLVGGGGKPAVKAFIRSMDPLPYIWGGGGPGGYDCSGAVGAVHLAHLGKPHGHGQRIYTTSSIHAGVMGLKPGLGGVLQIGVTAGTGHMAGRYGGLGFEAESSRTGIKVGPSASRPESFARKFHLARGGRVDQDLINLFARSGADIGGDQGKLRINGQTFDRGGTLSPGLNLLANRTGRPEPLVPAGGQGIDYDRLGKAVARALAEQPPRAYLDPNQARQGIRESQRRGGVSRRELIR